MNYITVKTPRPVMRAIEQAPKPQPTMTWAEMAKQEGHVGRVPPTMAKLTGKEECIPKNEAAIVAFLKDNSVKDSVEVAEAVGLNVATSKLYLAEMEKKGILGRERDAVNRPYKYWVAEND